ncbi:MAG: hypothetical protein ACYTKD_15835 [Planctomycetota bacterium]|jgi:hypothetical protein
MILRCAALLAFAAAFGGVAPAAGADPREGRSGKRDARIEGKIAAPEAATVLRVSAIDRDVKAPMIAKGMPVKEHPGRLLEGGTRFEVDVPAGTYDLHFELKDGVKNGLKLEGADMRVSAAGDAPALKKRDREAITKRVLTMRTFENEKHVLAIDGAGTRAKALVKLVRTNPTSYDGERVAIFRWEVWNFRKRTGSWVRERKSKVLRRFLVPKRKMDEVRWDFRPDLGGVDAEAGATVERDVDLGPAAPGDGAAHEKRPGGTDG